MVMLAGINIVTMPRFPWAIFPILGMSVGLMRQLGGLWGDGVSMKQIFFAPPSNSLRQPAIGAGAPKSGSDGASLVPQEILDGPHGVTIRRATASRQVITDLLKRMNATEREMLPADIETTVNALVERVASVAITLHRLDSDANGASLGSLDQRLESLRRETGRASCRERVYDDV